MLFRRGVRDKRSLERGDRNADDFYDDGDSETEVSGALAALDRMSICRPQKLFCPDEIWIVFRVR